jgi:hypothetical protein
LPSAASTAVDLRTALTASAGRPTYRRTDTHWNRFGALVAYNAVVQARAQARMDIDPARVLKGFERVEGGDLARLLAVAADVSDEDAVIDLGPYGPAPPPAAPLATQFESGGDLVETGRAGPTVMVIGDSFTRGFWQDYFAAHAGRYLWMHHELCGFQRSVIDEHAPELVVARAGRAADVLRWRVAILFLSYPTRPPRRARNRPSEIRLDVDQRRAVEAVEPTTESVVPSTRTSRTTLIAIGFGRTGERSAKVPRRSPWRGACTSRSRRARVHEIEQHEMRAARDAVERGRIARLELDRAFGVGAARVLRAVVAPRPRRADAADKVEARRRTCRAARPRSRPRECLHSCEIASRYARVREASWCRLPQLAAASSVRSP